MTTLADLRAALRVLLNDNAAEGYLWGDAALKLHLNDAIRDYSRSLPRQRETTVVTVAGQREYDLPADCLTVTGVVASGTSPDEMAECRDANGSGYELYGGKLVLRPTPTESGLSLELRYLAPHAGLVDDGDLSTVPAADEDLLLASACARALQGLAAEEAKRQRFAQRTGQSAERAAALYRQQYERGIRIRGARVRTRRLIPTDS
ncbi:MAG: phage adaptor protein [Chloroflexota bacterium]